MIRTLITIALPLLAPAACYLLYTWHVRRKGGETADDPFSWREIPWVWLLVTGTALLMITLFSSSFIGRIPPDSTYQAPHFEDGKRVPGRFVK